MILLFLTAIGLAIGIARAYKYRSDKAVFYERLLLPVILFPPYCCWSSLTSTTNIPTKGDDAQHDGFMDATEAEDVKEAFRKRSGSGTRPVMAPWGSGSLRRRGLPAAVQRHDFW